VTATGPKRTAWSCVRGGTAEVEGKGLHQRVVGMERAAQDHEHSPELLEFKEHLDDTQTQGLNLGWSWMMPGFGLDDSRESLPTLNS